MEWVVTTGPTEAAAVDAALDELGVDEDELEYEVLQPAKAGLFGRFGGQPCRIRARVKPISREKPGERGRGRGRQGKGRSSGRRGGGGGNGGNGGANTTAARPEPAAKPPADGGERTGRRRNRGRGGQGGGNRPGGGQSTAGGAPAAKQSATQAEQKKVERVSTSEPRNEEVPVGVQADVADEFMRGLVAAFGLTGDVSVRIEDDSVFVDVEGADLGLLVGPKGATLKAIEELVRTVVQRSTDGHGARIHVDVGGYQAKRRAALAAFATELAERVRASGSELALEPMSASDRKVVHDTVAALDGVTTTSEGDEPRRRVVVRPA